MRRTVPCRGECQWRPPVSTPAPSCCRADPEGPLGAPPSPDADPEPVPVHGRLAALLSPASVSAPAGVPCKSCVSLPTGRPWAFACAPSWASAAVAAMIDGARGHRQACGWAALTVRKQPCRCSPSCWPASVGGAKASRLARKACAFVMAMMSVGQGNMNATTVSPSNHRKQPQGAQSDGVTTSIVSPKHSDCVCIGNHWSITELLLVEHDSAF
eukprot:484682-Pelagomonas_calceolata.AAC.3